MEKEACHRPQGGREGPLSLRFQDGQVRRPECVVPMRRPPSVATSRTRTNWPRRSARRRRRKERALRAESGLEPCDAGASDTAHTRRAGGGGIKKAMPWPGVDRCRVSALHILSFACPPTATGEEERKILSVKARKRKHGVGPRGARRTGEHEAETKWIESRPPRPGPTPGLSSPPPPNLFFLTREGAHGVKFHSAQ